MALSNWWAGRGNNCSLLKFYLFINERVGYYIFCVWSSSVKVESLADRSGMKGFQNATWKTHDSDSICLRNGFETFNFYFTKSLEGGKIPQLVGIFSRVPHGTLLGNLFHYSLPVRSGARHFIFLNPHILI